MEFSLKKVYDIGIKFYMDKKIFYIEVFEKSVLFFKEFMFKNIWEKDLVFFFRIRNFFNFKIFDEVSLSVLILVFMISELKIVF